jgi:hypothetical protein
MKVKISLPRKVGKIKILWSQEMENLATEQKKQEELRQKRQKEHERLTKVL